MFDSLKNAIYLHFWEGKKKAGPHKELVITRSYDSYGVHVFDLLWGIKLRGDQHSRKHVSYRADRWNLIRSIKYVERNALQDAIREVLEQQESVKKS